MGAMDAADTALEYNSSDDPIKGGRAFALRRGTRPQAESLLSVWMSSEDRKRSLEAIGQSIEQERVNKRVKPQPSLSKACMPNEDGETLESNIDLKGNESKSALKMICAKVMGNGGQEDTQSSFCGSRSVILMELREFKGLMVAKMKVEVRG